MTEYLWDNLIEDRRVLCGQCALSRNGLILGRAGHIDIMSSYQECDGINLAYVTFYYYENIDYENFVTPFHTNSNILLPSPERAIIDYMRNEKWCDEGVLIEALKELLERRHDLLPNLYKVADFYKYDTEMLSYWLNEAREDTEV